MNSDKDSLNERFAAVYGSPGLGPRTLGPLRVFWPLVPVCVAAGWLLRAALPVPALSTAQAGFLFLALAIALAGFTAWSARRLQSFLKGAEGEEQVARILSFLPVDCTVFNDVQLDSGGPSFDHIVISPSGIFVIETKNWSGDITLENGKILCNGNAPNRPPLKQVKEAAAALLDHLNSAQCPDVPIQPVVCFVNNSPAGGTANIGGVQVCSDYDLHRLFENPLLDPPGTGALAIIAAELIRCVEDK